MSAETKKDFSFIYEVPNEIGWGHFEVVVLENGEEIKNEKVRALESEKNGFYQVDVHDYVEHNFKEGQDFVVFRFGRRGSLFLAANTNKISLSKYHNELKKELLKGVYLDSESLLRRVYSINGRKSTGEEIEIDLKFIPSTPEERKKFLAEEAARLSLF